MTTNTPSQVAAARLVAKAMRKQGRQPTESIEQIASMRLAREAPTETKPTERDRQLDRMILETLVDGPKTTRQLVDIVGGEPAFLTRMLSLLHRGLVDTHPGPFDEPIFEATKTAIGPIESQREYEFEPLGPSQAEVSDIVAFSMPIEDLDLTVRSYNCLKREGIHTVGELVERSEADLLDIRNFGSHGIDEVKIKLAGLGLSLRDSSPGFELPSAADRYSKDDFDSGDADYAETEQL